MKEGDSDGEHVMARQGSANHDSLVVCYAIRFAIHW
jgi:hypothetical protein